MALIKCPNCGKEISDASDTCVNCGYLLKTQNKKHKKRLIIIGIVLWSILIVASSSYVLYKNEWNFNEVCNTISNGNFSCILGHNWNEATCTTPETCSVCRTIRCEALGHKWNEVTCVDPMICSRCGARNGSALGHSTDLGYCKNCNQYIYKLTPKYIEIVDNLTSALVHVTDGLAYSQGSESSLFAYYCNFQVTDFDFTLAEGDMDSAYKICSNYEEFSKIKQYISEWKAAIPKECADDSQNEIERYYSDLADFLEFTKSINAKINEETKALQP